MRTLNIFTYNELSDAAKLKAVESFRAYRSGDDFDFSEYKASLDAFATDVGITIRNWSYGLDGCFVNYDDPDHAALADLTGARAYKWIVNNMAAFRRGPRVVTVRRDVNRHGFKRVEYIVKRISGVYPADDCCPYTGVFCDDVLLDPFREFLKHPDNRSIIDLIAEAIAHYCTALLNDLEYQESDEFLTEELINGGTPEFFENGTIYA